MSIECVFGTVRRNSCKLKCVVLFKEHMAAQGMPFIFSFKEEVIGKEAR
jgi:hypothetical protein